MIFCSACGVPIQVGHETVVHTRCMETDEGRDAHIADLEAENQLLKELLKRLGYHVPQKE